MGILSLISAIFAYRSPLLLACRFCQAGKFSQVKVKQTEANSFKIISAGLLNPQVSVQTRISCSSSQMSILAVGDVLLRPRVSILLSQAKVDQVDNIGAGTQTQEKVIGLDISMNVVAPVNLFYPLNHLVGEHEHSFQTEFLAAVVEKVSKTWPQHVHHHDIKVGLHR
jgi:hypothetical protein